MNNHFMRPIVKVFQQCAVVHFFGLTLAWGLSVARGALILHQDLKASNCPQIRPVLKNLFFSTNRCIILNVNNLFWYTLYSIYFLYIEVTHNIDS